MAFWRPFLWEKLRDKILPAGLEVVEAFENFLFPSLPTARGAAKRGDYFLVILHGMGGGADMQALADAAAQRQEGKKIALLSFQVLSRRFVLKLDGQEAEYFYPWSFRKLWARLDSLGLAATRLHHFRYWPWAMVAALRDYLNSRKIALTIFLHDFCYFCPRIHLLDGAFHYCGQPEDPSVCDECLRRSGPFARKNGDSAAYRVAHEKLLALATGIIAPSGDTATRYRKMWPALEIKAQPEKWGAMDYVEQIKKSDKPRLAIVGNIGRQKGADIVLALARYAAAEKLPLDLMIIGGCVYADEVKRLGVPVTGAYQSKDLPRLFAENEITGVWLPSQWPETYSFVFTEAWRCGLPVAVFDLGAPAERIKDRDGGRDVILPLSTTEDMPALYRALKDFSEK